MHERIPTMGFSKSLDLPFSFRVGNAFDWPVALYLILKNDVERFFFEMPFDVCGKCLQIPSLIGLNVIVCIHTCSSSSASGDGLRPSPLVFGYFSRIIDSGGQPPASL